MRAIVYIAGLTLLFGGVLIWGLMTGEGLAPGLADIMEAAKKPSVAIVLADLYIGFLILVGWVFYRDGFTAKAVAISASILILGNLAALLYILYLLISTRGDVWETLLGRNK